MTLLVRPLRPGDDTAALGALVFDAYVSLPGWRSDPDYEAWLGDLSQRAVSSIVVGAFEVGDVGARERAVGEAAPEEGDVVLELIDDDAAAPMVGGQRGRPVGCVSYVPPVSAVGIEAPRDDEGPDDPDAASFRALAVDPAAQGRGIGRALTEWCCERARHDGALRVRIHTLEAMAGAQRMYTSMGFVRDEENDEQWELPDGPLLGLAFLLEL